jgi:hypothetical protein
MQMAEHRITTRVPSHEIANADLSVKVRSDDQLLGELLISRGSVDWRPRNRHRVFRLRWEQFDSLMQERGRERAR